MTRRRRLRLASLQETLAHEPLADLLFTMVAILLLVTVVLLNALTSAAVSQAAAQDPAFTYDGATVQPLIATREGVRRSDTQALVRSDEILESPQLRAWLRADPTPILMITSDGIETAFALEAVLASEKITTLRQLRLTQDCSAFACAGRTAEPRP